MSAILVLNAGSSSLKFAAFEADGLTPILRGQVSGLSSDARFEAKDGTGAELPCPTIDPAADHAAAQRAVIEWLRDQGLGRIIGAGHRIVHGGSQYIAPTLVTDAVQEALDKLKALSPVHQPFGLGALRRMREIAPRVPQVACFDTAFHASQPDVATWLPLPRRYHDKGYRRYGFHGLNYEHVVRALPGITGAPLPRRLLAAHLGNGASLCAILDGKSIATTMGYSTADGLVMGTRTGALDPGVVIALIRDEHMGLEQLEDLLYRQSGLKGLSGISGDMRTLLASDRDEARFAIAHYCYSAARHAGSLITALGGLDGVVFTAGVGEHAAPIRARICDHLAWLGVSIDPERNAAHAPRISPDGARVPAWIVPADEEAVIARHTSDLVGRRA